MASAAALHLAPANAAEPAASDPVAAVAAAGDAASGAQLADDIARGCALNLRGDHAAALTLLEAALERVRDEPALRHGDDYRFGALALALARHGAAPDATLAEQLSHELARDAWLVGAEARRRWREQAAAALKLGVAPAS